MKNQKSEYRFTVNADPAAINAIVQSYLQANKFTLKQKGNTSYYYFNDPFIKGKRNLEYYIEGNQVVILAYIGTVKRPVALEGVMAASAKQSYRDDLAVLFNELKKLNDAGVQAANQNGAVNVGPSAAQASAVSFDVFANDNNKKKEKMVIIGFVISLIGLLCSFFGIMYGGFLIFLEFYFGIQGIRTKKKGLAIATIVIGIVSILIIILELFVYAMI